jgi:hypothetical protein
MHSMTMTRSPQQVETKPTEQPSRYNSESGCRSTAEAERGEADPSTLMRSTTTQSLQQVEVGPPEQPARYNGGSRKDLLWSRAATEAERGEADLGTLVCSTTSRSPQQVEAGSSEQPPGTTVEQGGGGCGGGDMEGKGNKSARQKKGGSLFRHTWTLEFAAVKRLRR